MPPDARITSGRPKAFIRKDMMRHVVGEDLEDRIGADVGSGLVFPEDILRRQGQRVSTTGEPHPLRRGSLRSPVQPHRPSAAAAVEGAGLPGHQAHRRLAELGTSDSARGARSRAPSPDTRIPAGVWRSRRRSFRATRCRRSTASAPTSTWSRVTHGLRRCHSTVDTPYAWELNIWYHTLNVGYRTRISGETDFPCIYGERVGLGRSYVRQAKLDYDDWVVGLREGRNYASDGKSHLIDFRVNGVEMGSGKDVELPAAGR